MPDLSRIKLVVFDVDGVLTDGEVALADDGRDWKSFNARDGAGIRYLERAGLLCAFLSGRSSIAVSRRARELGVELVCQDAWEKLPVFEELLKRARLAPEEVAYVGDDLVDLPVLRRAAFSACPADAVEEVKAAVHYVARLPGGRGAAREIIDYLLKETGKWDGIMARYR